MDEMGRTCRTHRREEKLYKVSVGKSEGNRPLERRRDKRKNNIKIDLKETGWEGVEWIHLVQHTHEW
jgi:hypothetical protein